MARRETAFAGLKQKRYDNIDEACEELGLNIDVFLRPERCPDDEGEYTVPVTDKVGVLRRDVVRGKPRLTYMATVGDGYQLVPYRRAFSIADPMVSDHGFVVVGGGAPNLGERGYLQIETGEEITLAKGDVIRNRILLTSSHDGTGKIQVRMTPYRPKSGTALTFDAGHPLAFKHTLNVTGRLAASKKSLRRIQGEWETFKGGVRKMQTVEMNDFDTKAFISQVLPAPNKKEGPSKRLENMWDEIHHTFNTSPTIRLSPATRGTLFGLVQAFAEWTDSRTPRASDKRDEVSASLDAKLVSDGAKKKAKAWSMALWLASKGNLKGAK